MSGPRGNLQPTADGRESSRVVVLRSVIRNSTTVAQIISDNEDREPQTMRQAIQRNCHVGFLEVRFIAIDNEVHFHVTNEGVSALKRFNLAVAKKKEK